MAKQNLSKSKNLRQKLLMVYHNDGILDMVVGITVLMLAIVMAFEAIAFIGLISTGLGIFLISKLGLRIPLLENWVLGAEHEIDVGKFARDSALITPGISGYWGRYPDADHARPECPGS